MEWGQADSLIREIPLTNVKPQITANWGTASWKLTWVWGLDWMDDRTCDKFSNKQINLKGMKKEVQLFSDCFKAIYWDKEFDFVLIKVEWTELKR